MNDDDEMPDLTRLRLAYSHAIAATDAADAALDAADAALDAAIAEGLTPENRGTGVRFDRCQQAEHAAGRAFLAALQQVDPACSICGCTQEDGCPEGCWWISTDPWICSQHELPAGLG